MWDFRYVYSVRIVVLMVEIVLGVDFKYLIKFVGKRYYLLYDVCYELNYLMDLILVICFVVGSK